MHPTAIHSLPDGLGVVKRRRAAERGGYRYCGLTQARELAEERFVLFIVPAQDLTEVDGTVWELCADSGGDVVVLDPSLLELPSELDGSGEA